MKKVMLGLVVALALVVASVSLASAYYVSYSNPPTYAYTGYAPLNNVGFYPGYSNYYPTRVHSYRDTPYYTHSSVGNHASYHYHPKYGAEIVLSVDDDFEHGCFDQCWRNRYYGRGYGYYGNYGGGCGYGYRYSCGTKVDKNEQEVYEFVKGTFEDYEDFKFDTYGKSTGEVYGSDGKDVPESNWRNKEVYNTRDHGDDYYGGTYDSELGYYNWRY